MNTEPKKSKSQLRSESFKRFQDSYIEMKEALEELIQLKDWKDKNGKDEHYTKEQSIAWDNARKSIEKATGKHTVKE